METVLTFIITNPQSSFTQDLYEVTPNFVHNANVVVLHEFKHFYDCIFKVAIDDFEFRILIHPKLTDRGTLVAGETILEEIKSKPEFRDIDIHFITRDPNLFKEANKFSVIKEDKTYWNMKYFNGDTAISHFLDTEPKHKKGQLTNNTVSKPRLKNEEEENKTKPKIFIGSSVQGLNIARAIRESLNHHATVHLWDDNGCFNTNEAILDGLERIVNSHDYGIFIFRPDDEIYHIKQGSDTVTIPRDNVIFEYGLFMGKHTRRKVFFLVPTPPENFKLMSDLLGIIPLTYESEKLTDAEKATNSSEKKLLYSDAVSSACDSIKTEISIL